MVFLLPEGVDQCRSSVFGVLCISAIADQAGEALSSKQTNSVPCTTGASTAAQMQSSHSPSSDSTAAWTLGWLHRMCCRASRKGADTRVGPRQCRYFLMLNQNTELIQDGGDEADWFQVCSSELFWAGKSSSVITHMWGTDWWAGVGLVFR